MSDTESQERMVLWKLRSSVARHISSPGGGMAKDVDTTEQGMCANDKTDSFGNILGGVF